MTVVHPVDTLNRLIVLHHRSLASYLSYASPAWNRSDGRAPFVLRQIADDHQQTVDRLGEMVMEMDGAVLFGGFSMTFASYHDLGFDFLRRKLIEHQRFAIDFIGQCVRQLDSVPMAQALAEEALGAAKAHLELLEELGSPAAKAVAQN